MLRALRSPISWIELLKRTAKECCSDNCLGLAPQAACCLLVALVPAIVCDSDRVRPPVTHDKGLVHRDIKPKNLFLLREGQVKIVDSC
jgi:serine/threonine protein kinase